MKQIVLLFALFCFALATPAFAKGHGSGHGAGHSSHAHSSGHSGYSGFGSSSASTHSANTARKRSVTKAIITRSTSPAVIAANHGRTIPRSTANVAATAPKSAVASASSTLSVPSLAEYYSGTPGYYNNGGGGYYYNPYAYYGYYNSPMFYDPYYAPFMMYYGFMYSPNYSLVNSPNYTNTANEEQLTRQPMDGFVVFYNDTLSGAVTVASRAISMETTDSGKDYDYRFHEKDPGLQYVTVYNDDDKQLNLVRLNGDTKKLWRVIHTGKLNIYDNRRGFIYQPQDIDVKSLTISYNGEIASLHSNSVPETKEWLTNYVNKAYGLDLDPAKFSWNELLIYVDKLN